jgi:MFS family permease
MSDKESSFLAAVEQPSRKIVSAWSPLRRALFRALWIATVVSNIGTWMHDVGAGWLMTSLAPSPLMVALVQSSAALPILLLALPAGALADIVDRRRYLIGTQLWMAAVAALLGASTLAGMTNAWSLLAFTFALGCGSAMTMPAWSAIAPELVPRSELRAAITLNGLGMNLSRAIGPALAGFIIASFGSGTVFVLNAASFIGVLAVLIRWRRLPRDRSLPAEPFFTAMRAGLRYARHSIALRAALARSAAFFLCASASWALLPLVVRQTLQAGSAVYGSLLAFIGTGAVTTAFFLPRLLNYLSSDWLVALATLAYAASMLALAHLRDVYLLAAVMSLSGAAWISVVSSLQVAAQAALPEWVRARGLSLFMVVFMGGMAGGGLIWGHLAETAGIPFALTVAAGAAVFGAVVTVPFRIGGYENADFTPSMHWPAPLVDEEPEPDRGPVLVTLEYRVQPSSTAAFLKLMRVLRRIRKRDGAFYWGLFQDTADHSRFVEHFMLESWVEHLRQHERVTVADRDVQERLKQYLQDQRDPIVSHYVEAKLVRKA